MKSLVLVGILLFSLASQARLCDGLFVATKADMQSSETARQKLARKLTRAGLAGKAYVARWVAKNKTAQGPFTQQGESLVSGVDRRDYAPWMNSVGKLSIGIGVYGLPENGGGTAYLRIGDQFFKHDAILENRKPKSFKRVFHSGEVWSYDYGLTEATIVMTASEIKDILKFYEARRSGEIVAQQDMPGYEKGERINPDFAHTGNNLRKESCAGACTSFLSDLWLDNMNSQSLAGRLRKIRDKYNLNYNYVARANVWMNFRNPAAHISLLRIDDSERDLMDNFMAQNSWGNIRGLYKYAFMPDGSPEHEVESYRSYRLSLADYLAGE